MTTKNTLVTMRNSKPEAVTSKKKFSETYPLMKNFIGNILEQTITVPGNAFLKIKRYGFYIDWAKFKEYYPNSDYLKF